MTASAQSYGAYGLHLRSSVALPFNRLPNTVDTNAADVTIRLGTVPRELPTAPEPRRRSALWEARRGAFLMKYEGVARYLVTNGRDVLVEPWGGSDDDIACIFAGTPLTALLQQRGMATFHAAAVQAADGAALLLGESGDGKSSLAATLVERGYALVADDVTAVVVRGNLATALPGFTNLRLWKATLDKMGVAHRARSRVRGTLEKYWVPAAHLCGESLPVSAAFVLTPQNRPDIRIESMAPGRAFRMLNRHAHRRRIMDAMDQRPAHFRAAAAIARDVPVMRVERPNSPFLLEELADHVEAHLAQLPKNGRKVGAKPCSAPARKTRPPAVAFSRRRSASRILAPAIVWLASWPKSGNTWLRAVLTNYLADDDQPASINALVGGRGRGRDEFDEYLGVSSADMTDDEVSRHLPTFRTTLAEGLLAARSSADQQSPQEPAFVKTHEVYRLPDRAPRFPAEVPVGAVYLVRNPLDVAVSYAHHLNWPIDRTIIKAMNNPNAREAHLAHGIYPVIPEPLTTWSNHVASWTEQTALPVHVARYEDLLADPHSQFGAIVRFAGLDWDGPRLERAIDHSAFHRLRAQEAADGFNEKQPTAPSFFRAGMAGGWREKLAPEQIRAIVDAHGDMMERFDYLREAVEHLAARSETA